MTVLAYSPVLPSVELFGAYEGIASATAVNETVSITFTPTEGTLFVVPYDSDTISQLQLEVGPTPSSYIPTPSSGGTATRGAETLTVAAADLPWPTPKVIGPELVTNGTFDTDVSGWTAYSGTIAHSSGRIELTNGVSSICRATQPITTVVGKVYIVTCDSFTGGTATTALLGASNNADLASAIKVATGAFGESLSLTFVATATTTYVGVTNFNTTTGIVGYFDNISVREIDPLSVSIQMDGRMTYADEGGVDVTFSRWLADSSNRVFSALNNGGGATGQPYFFQAENGVNDSVLGGATTYSPGILVPFNIASRHGSTFVNGAVDGTALTADNTPVALPDLSATDLNLAYDYNGTIRTFRMWNKDLTDAGIEEAST